MKRSWIGIGLLAVLLAGGIGVTCLMDRIHAPISRELTEAGAMALAGEWDRAEELYRESRQKWEDTQLFRACFADHGPMEEVDACFAMAEVYLYQREQTAFAAACAETARKADAMGQAHSLVWENMF